MQHQALVVAPWGYPPSWSKVPYDVEVVIRGLGEVGISGCVTCSSTLALASALKASGKFSRVRVVIFGLDTAVQPSDGIEGAEFREKVRDLYSEWLKILISDCKSDGCCRDLNLTDFSVYVLPGKGVYGEWRYLGSMDIMFIKVFKKVLHELSSLDYSKWVFIDITHGVNYQTIVTKYASLAAVAHALGSKGLLKTYILNSEPVATTRGLARCIELRKVINPPDKLNILDVTRLHTVMELVGSIQGLYHLEYFKLVEGVKELRRIKEEPLTSLTHILITKVLPAIKALRVGAVGPTFIGSKYDIGDYDLRLCKCFDELSKLSITNEEFIPRIDYSSKEVRYEYVPIWYLLVEVLNKVLSDVCGGRYSLNSDDLIKFLNEVAKLYNDVGLTNLKGIVEVSRDELKSVTRIWESISTKVVVPMEVYYVLWHLSKMSNPEINDLQRLIDQGKEEVRGEPRYRNFVAHAGIDFKSVKELLIENGKIKSVVYDNTKLSKVLQELKIIS